MAVAGSGRSRVGSVALVPTVHIVMRARVRPAQDRLGKAAASAYFCRALRAA